MGLPGHRRTSSDKRRRASHFALVAQPIAKDTAGKLHRSHRAAAGATEYNGHKIHVKGQEKKLEKLLSKKSPKSSGKATAAHADHDHAGHNH